jgi:glycosyltransferase involved in cell wall biosynthesis
VDAEPEVTVVVPAFNAEATISQAISSVLAQEGACAETIVVDDGSTDATRRAVDEIARGAGEGRVRQLSHAGGLNRGVAASRNLALAQARAGIVAFLDADDFLLPGALAAGLAVFRAFPGVVLVYGRVGSAGAIQSRAGFVGLGVAGRPFSLARWLLFENPLPTSGTMARRGATTDVRFPEGLQHQIEDWAAWLALSRKGMAYFLDQALACYRSSTGSWSLRLADRWVRHAQLVEEANLLRSLPQREADVSPRDVNEALAYRSGVLLVETVGQLARLRLSTARRCLASAEAIAGTPAVLARAAVWWAPRLRFRALFPPKRSPGPTWRIFTAS